MNILLIFFCHLSLCLHAIGASDSLSSDAPSPLPLPPPPPVDERVDNGTFGFYPTFSYVTEESLNGPRTNFLQWNERCDEGSLYFLTPRGWGIGNPGPMLLDERGRLIWSKHYDNAFGGQAYDFMVQSYKGDTYLTFWLGDDRIRGHGAGFYYMLNASYDQIYQVGAAQGMSADLHEFLITPEGTALMTMYEVVEYDLTVFDYYHPDEEQAGGHSYIWDGLFQEIDIETGNLVNQWRASDHINITTTYRNIGPGGSKDDPFDPFHLNSIEKDDLGNYLLSARYVHSLTYIDGRTGDTIWTLGGRMNDFMDLSGGNATNFAWQHDARFVPLDTFPNIYSPPAEKEGYTTRLLTMFDNAAEDQHYEYGLPLSRGLLLEVTYPTKRSPAKPPRDIVVSKREELDLNEQKILEINGTDPDYTVRVIKSYENPEWVRSSSQGSMQILPQGHGKDPKVFIGYGLNAVWTEFEADGTVLCNVHYASTTSWERGDIQSYRTYKFPWVGTPEHPPEIDISDDEAELYVSWNGATEVAHWILQCSESETTNEEAWEDVVKVPKQDFETAILLPDEVGNSRYLRMIALDRHGRRLDYGTSRVMDRGNIAADLAAAGTQISKSLSRMGALNMLLMLVFATCTALVLFHVYRQYLRWRTGKQSAGPLRWRKGAAYRLLGDS